MKEVFEAIVQTPSFAIALTLIVYLFMAKLQEKARGLSILNPLLLSILLIVWILKSIGVDYPTYMKGGKYIGFLIAPATVALVVNLYKNWKLLTDNWFPILVGIAAGVLTSALSVILIGRFFRLAPEMTCSFLPKSLTTAIGLSLSAEYGGYEEITTIAIVLTGVMGSVMGPGVMKLFGIHDPVAVGVGIGTASHAMGTSKALEMGEKEGAMAGLSIALAGLLSVIILPFFLKFI